MSKNVWGLYVCFLKSKSIQAKKYPRLPYLPLPPFLIAEGNNLHKDPLLLLLAVNI